MNKDLKSIHSAEHENVLILRVFVECKAGPNEIYCTPVGIANTLMGL